MEPAFIQFPSFCLVADFFFLSLFFPGSDISHLDSWIANMCQHEPANITENPTMSAVQQNYNEAKINN